MSKLKNSDNLIKRLDEFAPGPVRRMLLVMLIAQIIFYYGARLLTSGKPHHIMTLPIDQKFPVLPWTVIIYLGAFVFWAVTYAMILRSEEDGSRRFIRAEINGKLFCAIVYLIIPTTLIRPEITSQSSFAALLRFLYAVDAPEQLFPSIHCYVSWMCVVATRGNERISENYRKFTVFMAVMICLSTLTTKQHLFVDVISGILLAETVWFVSGLCGDPRKTFVDRKGNKVMAKDSPSGILAVLYDLAAGRLLLRGMALPGISVMVGKILDTKLSRILNRPFVAHQRIDMSEYEQGPYDSFNDLFSRHILPGARPVDDSEDTVISPCDGKVQILSIDPDSRIEIKGIVYNIDSLLRDSELSKAYSGGTLMLFRLGVGDYHRYVYPVDAVSGEKVYIDGILNTVSPPAVERRPVYCENIREYTLLYTKKFGTVLMMEVGAMLVGKISSKASAGPVRRGEEKGYFEFGASSIILLFEKGKVIVDEDLIRNTNDGFETLVKLGERVGEHISL